MVSVLRHADVGKAVPYTFFAANRIGDTIHLKLKKSDGSVMTASIPTIYTKNHDMVANTISKILQQKGGSFANDSERNKAINAVVRAAENGEKFGKELKHSSSDSGKARPYIFENARRDPQTGQVIVRFNGGGDRNWVEIYMRRDDPMNTNYSEVVQWLKERFAGKVGENFATRIARGEIEKAARKVVEMETSRSSRTNTQQAMQNVSRMTSNAKKKYSSVQHSLYTEVFNDDELAHHGILGMKWGVRRYQNEDGSLTPAGAKHYGVASDKTSDISSRKGIQKRLNDVDTAIARNKRAVNDETNKARELKRKAENAKSIEKKEKLSNKANEHLSKAEQATKNIAQGKKEIQDLLNKAKESNYNITMKDVKRNVSDGRELTKSLLMSAAGLALLGGIGIGGVGFASKSMPGTKYKVSSVKDGEHSVGIIDKTKAGKKITVVSDPTNSGKGMYAIARSGELPESTRVTGKEESDFWKAYAKKLEEEQRRK